MSIYDSIGGAAAVRAAVDDFYARVLADRRLAPFFARTDLERLKAHQRAFIAAAIGGPEIFAGRDMAGLGAEVCVLSPAACAGMAFGSAEVTTVGQVRNRIPVAVSA